MFVSVEKQLASWSTSLTRVVSCLSRFWRRVRATLGTSRMERSFSSLKGKASRGRVTFPRSLHRVMVLVCLLENRR